MPRGWKGISVRDETYDKLVSLQAEFEREGPAYPSAGEVVAWLLNFYLEKRAQVENQQAAAAK